MLVRPGPGETVPPSADEELRRFREYASWYRDLASRGRVVGGERLADDAEAERIAAGCPHLKYGGVLEIRRIDRPEGNS